MELKRLSLWIQTTNSKLNIFQTTLPKSFYIRNQSIQWWASRSAVTMVLQTASEILLYLPARHYPKKSSFHKMQAHVPFCSWTGGCSTHSLDWKPGLPSPGRLPWAVKSADQQPWSSYSPQELQESPVYQVLINSLKYCLMNFVPELYFLET